MIKGDEVVHDLKYASQIVDSLKEAFSKRGKRTLATIDVYLSPLSHVTPQRLKEVFDILSKEAGFGNAVLNIGIAELSLHCRQCGKIWKSAKPVFECPGCDSADFELDKYEEFRIDSIRIGSVHR